MSRNYGEQANGHMSQDLTNTKWSSVLYEAGHKAREGVACVVTHLMCASRLGHFVFLEVMVLAILQVTDLICAAAAAAAAAALCEAILAV